jgi:glycerol-3-phosphate cytidylyltransferase-like family protein
MAHGDKQHALEKEDSKTFKKLQNVLELQRVKRVISNWSNNSTIKASWRMGSTGASSKKHR